MKPTEAEAVWDAIDDQRTRTADLLEQLTPQQWDQPSLCRGWTVRHVAAHLTLQQLRVRDLAAFVSRNPRVLRSWTANAIIHDSAILQAKWLSGQDVAIPLGANLTMRPTASALAATRRWDTRGTALATVFGGRALEDYRLTATDTEWTRGQGPEIAGPAGALLILLTGRSAALQQLTGDGADRVRSAG